MLPEPLGSSLWLSVEAQLLPQRAPMLQRGISAAAASFPRRLFSLAGVSLWLD
jgi:hypothetical protein